MIVPEDGSVAHCAVVYWRRLKNLRYIHSVMPELLFSLLDDSNRTHLHHLINYDVDKSLQALSSPLSAASDVLRFLLRHWSLLRILMGVCTLYDYLPAEDIGSSYARRLLLLAGASSLFPPGVLPEMNYARRC